MFYLMDDSQMEIAIVDVANLYCDIDLAKYKTLKVVFMVGSNKNFNVLTNCTVIQLEDGIDYTLPATKQDYARVYDFEATANKQQVLTYCQTSGSTGFGS